MDFFQVTNTRKTAVEVIIDKIKTLLIERKLHPGDMIPSETVLAESLKTSRGSIREAMKILSAYGIVEIRQGAGTFISKSGNPKIFDPLLFKILVDDFDYRELIEIRDIMERGIVRLIIENASDNDLKRLETIMQQFHDLSDTGNTDRASWDALDIAYHHAMGEIAHNTIVSNMYNFIIELFAPTINARLGYGAHAKLHEALMARDKPRAYEMLTLHTQTWRDIHFGVQSETTER